MILNLKSIGTTLEVENIEELKSLIDAAQKNIDDLEENLEKINDLELTITRTSEQ